MKCYASQPQPTRRLAAQLNSLLKSIDEVSPNKIIHEIKPKSKLQYACRILKRLIEREPNIESDKTKCSRSGEVKVGDLRNQRAKQSDPRLSWYMFHSICRIYQEVKASTDSSTNLLLKESRWDDRAETSIVGPKEVCVCQLL